MRVRTLPHHHHHYHHTTTPLPQSHHGRHTDSEDSQLFAAYTAAALSHRNSR